MLKLNNLSKTYRTDEVETVALNAVNIEIERGRRNVHAYAVGRLVDFVHPDETRNLDEFAGRGVFYNPYRFASFVDNETWDPITAAEFAQFDESGRSNGLCFR